MSTFVCKKGYECRFLPLEAKVGYYFSHTFFLSKKSMRHEVAAKLKMLFLFFKGTFLIPLRFRETADQC